MFGVSRCKLLLHLEWIGNEVLLYSTGNCIQFIGMDYDGRKYKKGNVYIPMTGSLCYGNWRNIVNQLYSKKLKNKRTAVPIVAQWK